MIHTDHKTLEFITANLNADTDKLLLNARKYPEIDIPFVVDQIRCRKILKNKLPEWSSKENIIVPSRISTEQCSSELTASYKASLFKGGILCDLTGGMGVDSYYFSLKAGKLFYVERFEDYCKAAKHNFKILGADNIEVVNADSRDFISEIPEIDCFYIDPARRSDTNKRIFAIDECEPDVLSMKDKLFAKASSVILKISPMADISFTLSLLPEITEIHCVSVKNECKELLFILEKERKADDVKVKCINFDTNGNMQSFSYILNEEQSLRISYSDKIMRYLYEPNSSIMKAGAFKSVAEFFHLKKLGINTHLYTSDTLIENFPGRVFEVETTTEFSSSLFKRLKKEIPKANITTRNFPLSVEEFRKKSSVKEGGDIYIFATTLGFDLRLIIKCRKP